MYRWDLRTRACLHRHQDEGSLRGTTIDLAPNNRYYAVGCAAPTLGRPLHT